VLSTAVVDVLGHDPLDDEANAFDAWMRAQHVPHVLGIAGVAAIRRFVLNTDFHGSRRRPSSPRFLTIYHLDSAVTREDDDYLHEKARARAMAYVPDQRPFALFGTRSSARGAQVGRENDQTRNDRRGSSSWTSS
jgi:hypothetical protein